MFRLSCLLLTAIFVSAGIADGEEAKLSALIVDGHSNHHWKETTPLLKRALEASRRFTVEVETAPKKHSELAQFKPKFSAHPVVIHNYNSDGSVTRTPDADWSKATQKALVDYVSQGGGLVIVHAANNSFPHWKAYNEMIGLGGWGHRNEKWGPYVYYKKDKLIRDNSAGKGGWHGPEHEFQIVVRDHEHPITRGMPRAWMHTKDELYSHLRGPAKNMTVLATAFSPRSKAGRDVHEPLIMTIAYGKGRVFHLAIGHEEASRCAGFVAFLQRGTEWAATGKVTIPIPRDFPAADKARESSIFANDAKEK